MSLRCVAPLLAMTQADMSRELASASGAPACSADSTHVAGPHAERLENLYPSAPATVTREEGLMLYRDMVLGRRFCLFPVMMSQNGILIMQL